MTEFAISPDFRATLPAGQSRHLAFEVSPGFWSARPPVENSPAGHATQDVAFNVYWPAGLQDIRVG